MFAYRFLQFMLPSLEHELYVFVFPYLRVTCVTYFVVLHNITSQEYKCFLRIKIYITVKDTLFM